MRVAAPPRLHLEPGRARAHRDAPGRRGRDDRGAAGHSVRGLAAAVPAPEDAGAKAAVRVLRRDDVAGARAAELRVLRRDVADSDAERSFAMRTPVRTPERPSPTRPCYHQAESLLLGSLRKSLTISESSYPPKRRRNSSCCSPGSDDDSFIGVTRPSPRRCSGSRSALAAYLAFDSPEPSKRSPFREPPYLDLTGPAPPPPVLGTPVRPRPVLDARRTPPTRPRPVEAPIAPPVFEPPSDDGESSDDAPPPPLVTEPMMRSPPRPTRPLGPGMEPDARGARSGVHGGGADDAARRAADGAAGRGRGRNAARRRCLLSWPVTRQNLIRHHDVGLARPPAFVQSSAGLGHGMIFVGRPLRPAALLGWASFPRQVP